MHRESKELREYQNRWIGKTVIYRGESMEVAGVGDDGAQCDYDQRRKYKPTGILILKDTDGKEHAPPDSWVSLQNDEDYRDTSKS